ncbi:hypothetical protein Dsin_032211 [Dipteronia sinensis]|uniref:Uncharacterized protein n=1 Tax=Dipteronia sinensis TaxID=43782 RepID=A0AAE0DU38_9ROSI|nr:hypothetical protein Dsin_032211 [Dipteronia sinensis]
MKKEEEIGANEEERRRKKKEEEIGANDEERRRKKKMTDADRPMMMADAVAVAESRRCPGGWLSGFSAIMNITGVLEKEEH